MGIVCKLEDDLISSERWEELYFTMPKECREVVDGPHECIEIGKNEEKGWFIIASGQDPIVLWAER